MNNPDLYAECSSPTEKAINFVLDKYLENIVFKKDNVSILEVGFGDGNTTAKVLPSRIPKKIKEIVGIDICEEMVKYAMDHYCERQEVKFVQLDICNKDIPVDFHQRFDHAFTFFVLPWIASIRNAFRNLFEMLCPDGDLLGIFASNTPILQVYIEMLKNPRWRSLASKEFLTCVDNVLNTNGKEMTETILKETGFLNYFCKTEKRTHSWSNYEDFKKFLMAVNLFAPNLSEIDRSEYMDEFLKEIGKQEGIIFEPNEKNIKKVVMEYETIILYASKI